MEKKKILVVDDEYAIRELIEMSIESDYDVIKAEDAQQALEYALEKPDLIVLDIMMPKVDGYHVCRKLKSDPVTKDIPIIMLTAKHSMEDLEKAIECDVDEFITKPFEPDFLKRRIDCYLVKECNPERKLIRSGKSIHYVKEKDGSRLE